MLERKLRESSALACVALLVVVLALPASVKAASRERAIGAGGDHATVSQGNDGDDAGSHKKKKKKKPATADAATPTAVSSLARKVEKRLLSYDTAGARAMLPAATSDEDAGVALATGLVLCQEKKYADAATALQRAAAMVPADPAPWIYLGETYLAADRKAEADAAFGDGARRAEAILAADPEDADALYYLGVARQRQKRYGEAIQTLERARAESPGDARVVYQLGATRAFNSEWQAAVDVLSEAIAMDSGIAYAYYYRGLSASKVNRKDLLVNDLDRFLALAPNAPDADRARQILAAARG